MKSYLILLSIVLYCIAFTIVCYLLQINTFEKKYVSIMTHLPLLLFSLSLYSSEYIGKNSEDDKNLQKIGKICIVSFLIGYCLNSMGLVTGITYKLFWFYGLNLIGALMIYISAIRHRYFDN